MAYDYYRGYQPQQWGTVQYQLPQAPVVSYVPQANWSGMDYYRAHSQWADAGYDEDEDSIFDHIRRFVRRSTGTAGMPSEEARSWHQRVYAGMVDMRTVSPDIIGAAAGYEALRFWEANQFLRTPVLDDYEREEDAIMGLAVAEATKLWGYTGRLMSDRGRREAGESAAETVHRIYRRNHRRGYDSYRRDSSRGRYDSLDYDDSYDGDGYDRSLRRRRSFVGPGVAAGYDSFPAQQTLLSPSYVVSPGGAYPQQPVAYAQQGGYLSPNGVQPVLVSPQPVPVLSRPGTPLVISRQGTPMLVQQQQQPGYFPQQQQQYAYQPGYM